MLDKYKELKMYFFFFHDEFTHTKIDILLKNGERIFKEKGIDGFSIDDDFLVRLLAEVLEKWK